MSDDERRTPEREEGMSAAWRRRRRLDAVFGDVLPGTTGDERDTEVPATRSGDDWLREQVPPHHG